ncbi:MAG: glycosyltransferase [Terracidiphilus sp.]|jgi:glycosyltransferase involved in cell wall biosynthesis
MQILHVIDSFSPATGGPPEAVRQLVKASRATGTHVEAVCLDSPQEEFLSDLDCPVHALDESFLGRYAFSPRLWRWLRANAGRFDGMVMHGLWTFPGSALRSAAHSARRPYGIFVHGALDPWFNKKYRLKHAKKLIYWPLQYAVLRDAAAVFFTTTTERDLALTSFRPCNWKSVVAPLGITEDEYAGHDPAEQIAEFYRALPALRGRRFLLFLARLHEKKGCDLLIEAFARTADRSPEVDLVMAGPDQTGMQAKLESRAKQLGIAGRVHWPGMIGGDVKWGALRACDAFILPSHQENFGVSVAEALAAGRPVLLSYAVNIWPEIENDGVGMAADDTLEGAVRLLQRWFSLPAAEQAAMAARAHPCFAARFSMERTAAAINEVFGA